MKILGVKIDQITYQEALERAKAMIDAGGSHYVVTPNPEIIVRANREPQLRKILNNADLSVPDGMGLVMLGRLTGRPIPERVTGVDLLDGLAALATEGGFDIFLLGAGEGVAERAASKLKLKYPGLRVTGTYSGDPDPKFDKQTRRILESKKIDILAVAYGAPKQEKWIARNLPYLNLKLAIGVGGALDYISGERKRAPTWLQKAGLEWLFRLLKEPRRVSRQLALPYFVYLVLKERSVKR
ncbi:MAG: WecB/TagA/CpsF family glycosyltransferase [bacterium]|nr:WecB/TagA/CpsF family glycosyltransferase [bacterium]